MCAAGAETAAFLNGVPDGMSEQRLACVETLTYYVA
jgi:hypothetical protein